MPDQPRILHILKRQGQPGACMYGSTRRSPLASKIAQQGIRVLIVYKYSGDVGIGMIWQAYLEFPGASCAVLAGLQRINAFANTLGQYQRNSLPIVGTMVLYYPSTAPQEPQPRQAERAKGFERAAKTGNWPE